MRLILDGNELKFIEADTADDQTFCKNIEKYKLIQHGAAIFIYDRASDKLLAHYNPFDNTQLIYDPAGVEVANLFGTKRFLMFDASTDVAAKMEAKPFGRDRSFPLEPTTTQTKSPFQTADLKSVLDQYDNEQQFYREMAKFFADCADFLPTKQEEYKTGGEQQDKYCRFHLGNQANKDQVVTEHLFLLDKNNSIIGTISATVSVTPEGNLSIYLYDEVVDYRIRLSRDEKELLRALQTKLQSLPPKDKADDDTKIVIDYLTQQIAAMTEEMRSYLMGHLFQAMRKQLLDQTIPSLLPNLPTAELAQRTKEARAFIRTASGRTDFYEKLGCGQENPGVYVIHGDSTNQATLLGKYLKEEWANAKLQSLSRPKESKQTAVADPSARFFSSYASVPPSTPLQPSQVPAARNLYRRNSAT